MQAKLQILLVILFQFCLSGCLNQALTIARSPGAVVDAVTTQTANSLVGDDLGSLFSDSATADSIDQALLDNPDALNGQELRQLRSELETHNMGTDGSAGISSSGRKHKYYDRRAKDVYTSPYRIDKKTGMVYNIDEIGRLDAPRVPLENKLPADRLLRSRDEWRFSVSPHQTNLINHDVDKLQFKNKFKPIIIKNKELPAIRKTMK